MFYNMEGCVVQNSEGIILQFEKSINQQRWINLSIYLNDRAWTLKFMMTKRGQITRMSFTAVHRANKKLLYKSKKYRAIIQLSCAFSRALASRLWNVELFAKDKQGYNIVRFQMGPFRIPLLLRLVWILGISNLYCFEQFTPLTKFSIHIKWEKILLQK